MDPWQAGGARPTGHAPEVDEAEARRAATVARGVGVGLLLVALMHAGLLLQLLLFVYRWDGVLVAVAVALGLATVGNVGCGAGVYQGDHRSALASVVVSGLSAAFASAWFVWLFLNGTLSLLALLAGAGSALVTALCVVALPFTAHLRAFRASLE